MRISLLVQQGREGLVDQEAEDHVQHSLEEGEGHIEDGQALDEAVRGGENSLIHTDDGVQRQTVAHHIGGIHQEVVEGYRQDRHQRGADNSADQSALAGLIPGIDVTGGEGKDTAHHEVKQLTHIGGGGAVEHGEQQVLQEGDHDAVDRAEREGGQQLRQIGHVQLYEGGDQSRDGEFNEHQQEGHAGEHCGNSQLVGAAPIGRTGGGDRVGIGFRHKKYTPFFI